jgi:hypothetical protein
MSRLLRCPRVACTAELTADCTLDLAADCTLDLAAESTLDLAEDCTLNLLLDLAAAGGAASPTSWLPPNPIAPLTESSVPCTRARKPSSSKRTVRLMLLCCRRSLMRKMSTSSERQTMAISATTIERSS